MGILTNDPRLSNMIKILSSFSHSGTFEGLKLDPSTFKTVLSENIVFVTKAFQNRLVIPAFEAFCENITKIYEGLKEDNSGECDSFLRELAGHEEDKFGIAVCTVDGQRFSIGDAADPFSLQAIRLFLNDPFPLEFVNTVSGHNVPSIISPQKCLLTKMSPTKMSPTKMSPTKMSPAKSPRPKCPTTKKSSRPK